ncbi:hypothetical protein [Kordia jejudonensis]|uniref:hypothetical protein n=1 Tax=Kordia jejudonensis TaxID=1348245 RepID=UPI000628FA7F|nr:hypothetical protein [Kordia jejudonensis]
MKLSYYCAATSCGKINYIKVNADNRYDLKDEIGKEFNERCKHCGKHTKKHINRLYAEPNSKIIWISILITIILSIAVFIASKKYVILLVYGIPLIVWKTQIAKAKNFNKLMID